MIVIEVHNVPKAQGVKHLGGIGTDLPIHGFFVVFELTINIQDRLSPGVERIVIQSYFVVVVRQALSKAGNKKAPVTGLEQTHFKICTKPWGVGARVPALPIGAALKAETAHELVRGRVGIEVHVTGNVNAVGPAACVVFVLKAVDLADGSPPG